MKNIYICTCLVLYTVSSAIAQVDISGNIADRAGKPLESVSVNLKDSTGRIVGFTRSDQKGEYSLKVEQSNTGKLWIEASSIGYKKVVTEVTGFNKSYDFILEGSEIILETVNVRNRPSLTVRGDTLNYRTSDFASSQDRSIGDVLKKMPGIEVALSGRITYNGKAISNLYIDGDNLLDDQYNIGTNNIPQQAVGEVQVIQNDQPLKMMRENNMSEDVSLNLVIKEDAKLKLMGEGTIGAGTPERFDGNLSAMVFGRELKSINNIKGNNIGRDPGSDLTAHNMGDYLKGLENSRPDNLLSVGEGFVPPLSQDRYLFNTAGLVNLNNLYKFNDDLRLRANISYLYDEKQQEYKKFSDTYLPDDTISYREFQNNGLNSQKLRAQVNLNENAEKHYLNNTSILTYAPSATNSGLIINDSLAQQALDQQTLDFSNEFNYRKKLESDNVLNFYSYINRITQPETLTVAPGLNAEAFNGAVPYAAIEQHIDRPFWYMNSYVSFAFVNDKVTQTYKGGFNFQDQQLNSELYKVQNDQTDELAFNAINRLHWSKTKFYAEGIYEYSDRKLKARLTLPLSHNLIRYNDSINRMDGRLSKFFLNPSLDLKYQTSAENYLTANYRYSNELGGIEDIFQGGILKNYRSLFANDAPVSETRLHAIAAGFHFRKAMEMLFFNLTANYSRATLNTLSSLVLSKNIQSRVVLPLSNHMNGLKISANASKYLFALNSTVSGSVSFNEDRFQQLQNDQLLPLVSRTMLYRAGIEVRLSDFMNYSHHFSYAMNSNKAKVGNARETDFKQLRQQAALSVAALENMFVNLSAEHLFSRQSSQQDLRYFFADMSIKYKILKRKVDLDFSLTNIANIKSFNALSLSANTLTSGTYFIPGRVALFRVTFNY